MNEESNDNFSQDLESVDADTISTNMKHDLGEATDALMKGISAKQIGGGNSLNIKSIENLMSKFISNTRNISLNAVSDMLSNYDEAELVASKKENIPKEG